MQGDDMELSCQLVSNGIHCGDPRGYRDPRRAELEPGAAAWRLLLQLDSDGEQPFDWGDLGRLYFWVRADDARRGDFANVWVLLQCN